MLCIKLWNIILGCCRRLLYNYFSLYWQGSNSPQQYPTCYRGTKRPTQSYDGPAAMPAEEGRRWCRTARATRSEKRPGLIFMSQSPSEFLAHLRSQSGKNFPQPGPNKLTGVTASLKLVTSQWTLTVVTTHWKPYVSTCMIAGAVDECLCSLGALCESKFLACVYMYTDQA